MQFGRATKVFSHPYVQRCTCTCTRVAKIVSVATGTPLSSPFSKVLSYKVLSYECTSGSTTCTGRRRVTPYFDLRFYT